MFKILSLALLVPFCLACAPIAPDDTAVSQAHLPMSSPQPQPAVEDSCDPAQWAGFIGSSVEKMRPALEGRNARILSLRSIRTMDYLPSRINVDIDNAGNVLGIWCG